jgi:hypothetical protein
MVASVEKVDGLLWCGLSDLIDHVRDLGLVELISTTVSLASRTLPTCQIV